MLIVKIIVPVIIGKPPEKQEKNCYEK